MAQKEESIIRSLLDPTIALDEMSYEDTEYDTNKNFKAKGELLSNEMGGTFPFIIINDYTISQDELQMLEIDTSGFLPQIQITMFINQSSTFISTSLPKDGDLMSVFIRSRNDTFKPIRNDYLISTVDSTKSSNEQGQGMVLNMTGELFVPHIRDEVIKSHKGNTYDVLQAIADELGLGFASNDTGTVDEQTWICPNDNYQNYINHICDSSWKDDQSFYTCFIDIYYHLNYINVNNQFSNSTEIDEALADTLMSNDTKAGEEIAMAQDKKVFTNIADKRGTTMFIKRYQLLNQSSDISKRFGYKMYSEFFEQNSLATWSIYSEPLIVEGSATDKILLRGRAGENFYETQIKKRWSGIQYTLPEHNVHEKYLYSRVHNLMNIQELNKLQVNIEVPRANFNIYRGERIPCIFVSNGDLMKTQFLRTEEEENSSEGGDVFNAPGSPALDKFYTGFYMINGMRFIYSAQNPQDTDSYGFFAQDIILTRREWPTP